MIIHEPALYLVGTALRRHMCVPLWSSWLVVSHVWVSCWRPSGAHRNIIQMRTHMHNDRGCLLSGVLDHVCDPCVFFPRGSFLSWGGGIVVFIVPNPI